jgi:hypothetical protein
MANLKDKIFEWLYLVALAALVVVLLGQTLPPSVLEKMGFDASDTIPELSGLSAFLLYALTGILLLRFSIKWVFPDLKLSEFFKSGDLSVKAKVAFALILALALVLHASISKAETPPHLILAKKYVGVTESPRNSNRGKEVEMFLRYTGLGGGHSYCAAFVSFCIGRSNVHEPMINSAAARAFVTAKSIRASYVLSGVYRVPEGSIVVWQRGTGWQGHVGFVVRQTGPNQFITIEANTSSGKKGSQFDGGGVYQRTRSICPTDHFRIIAFTPVTYI